MTEKGYSPTPQIHLVNTDLQYPNLYSTSTKELPRLHMRAPPIFGPGTFPSPGMLGKMSNLRERSTTIGVGPRFLSQAPVPQRDHSSHRHAILLDEERAMRTQWYNGSETRGTLYPILTRGHSSRIRLHWGPAFEPRAVQRLRRLFLCHCSSHLGFIKTQTGTLHRICLLI